MDFIQVKIHLAAVSLKIWFSVSYDVQLACAIYFSFVLSCCSAQVDICNKIIAEQTREEQTYSGGESSSYYQLPFRRLCDRKEHMNSLLGIDLFDVTEIGESDSTVSCLLLTYVVSSGPALFSSSIGSKLLWSAHSSLRS